VKQSKLARGNGEVKHKAEDERKTKVQLIGELAEMRQQIVELEAHAKQIYPVMDESTRESIAISNQLKHNLAERVKELRCLYGMATIAEKSEITLDELYQEVANLLPSSWQYPEICCARITTEDKEFRTANYRDTKWKLCSDIKVGGVKAGAVEVNYLEERPALDEGPFSREERRLIDAVAERMGKITEHKRVEEELVRLSNAVKMSTDSIVIGDLDGKIIDVNEATLKMYGTDDKRDLIGKNSFDLIAPEELEKALAGAKEMMEKGYVANREYHIITKGGGRVPVEMSVAIMKDADGKPIGSVGISRDITERKKAEKALRESEEKYRTQFEQALDAIFISDAETGMIIDCNQEACNLVGGKKSEIVGQHQRILHPPQEEMRGEVTKTFKQHLGEEAGAILETQVITKKGELKEVTIKASPLELGGKKVIQEMFRDITAWKKAEAQIRELSSVVEQSIDGIATGDLEPKLLYVNDAFARMHGYSPAEMVGMRVAKLHSEEQMDEFEKGIEQIKTEGSWIGEIGHVRKDGTPFPTHMSVTLLRDEEGKLLGIAAVCRDITERKKTEEELEARKKKLENYIESMVDGVVLSDLKGTTVDINRACLKLLGYKRKTDVVGRPGFIRTIPKKDMPKIGTLLEEIIKKGYVRDREITVLARDKREIPILFSATLIKDPEGKPTSIFTILKDITERNKAEKRLQESEEKLRVMFGSITDAVIVTDLTGTVVEANAGAAHLVGCSNKEELIGRNAFEFVSPNDRALAMNATKKTLEEGLIQERAEYTILTVDGREIDTDSSAAVLYDSSGNPTGIINVVRDITDRKRAEEKLKESEEKFRTFMETATDLMNITDKDGNLTDVNESMTRVLGYSREELIGMNIAQILAKEALENDFKPPIERLIKDGEFALDTTFATKDGKKVYGRLTTVAFHDSRGRYAGHRAVFHDLTERKQAEEELREKNEQLKAQREELVRKATELELVSQVKSEFLASMSHELRTPLSAVIGFSELMLDGVPGEINDEQRGCLNDILDSGRRLLSLINDILDLSKVEAGKIELKPQNLDIAAIVSDAVQIIKPVLNKNRQEIEVSVTQGLPKVRGDKNRLEQILLNLLSNASKFTDRGSRMRIHVGRKGDYCQVAVIDTGIGIKKEDQEHVFEAFVQGETLSDRKKEGTGLGLTLTKQFVEAIGGRIWMESEYGKGSTFIFTIPLAGEPLEPSLGDKQSSYY
jgi:PAS domain S-box-containing protein